MFDSKLIRLYISLDEAEIRQFKKWVKSPVHNQHKDVQTLFEYLFTRQEINSNNTKRERIFEYLYPKETINMARLRHIMSFATEVLENFISYKETTLSEQNTAIALVTALRKRNLKKDAQKQEQDARKILETQIIQNEDYYWSKYQLEVELFRLETTGDRPAHTNLQAVMDNAASFFVLSALRYACTSISHQNLYKTTYQIPFLEPILQAIEQGNYSDNNAVLLYHACYLSLTQPDEDSHYELLKSYLLRFSNVLPKEEFKEIYEAAVNYCIKRLNKGNRHYSEEAFDLYMQGIENHALLDKEGFLSHFAYKNIVAIGLHLGKTEQIENFIPQGEQLLHPDHRENYILYNTAKFYFATKNYDKAIRLLISMEFDDLFMTLDAKMMLLKIYVMEQNFDLAESFVHSFTQYLRRKSDMSYHQKGYLNTVRLTQKIIHVFGKEEKEQLVEEIKNTDPLPEKKWLLSQLGVE